MLYFKYLPYPLHLAATVIINTTFRSKYGGQALCRMCLRIRFPFRKSTSLHAKIPSPLQISYKRILYKRFPYPCRSIYSLPLHVRSILLFSLFENKQYETRRFRQPVKRDRISPCLNHSVVLFLSCQFCTSCPSWQVLL